jgi:hypothetical protein
VRLPLPRLLRRLWHHLPLWDDLSLGTQVSSLLPRTDDATVYSSRSRLYQLIPPDDYTPDPGGRRLGHSADGRPLTLAYEVPVFTMGVPSAFLAQQVLDDLEADPAVVVISPHRSVLDRIARQASGSPIHWLDPQNSHRSAHLALVNADEWDGEDDQTVVEATEAFLADLGVDVALPSVRAFCHQLISLLVRAAKHQTQDLAFTEFHTVTQSTQALRQFLLGVRGPSRPDAQALLVQLTNEEGYVQAVTILSAIRTALAPLETGPLHALCQPPFLSLHQLLSEGGLLLVPMTDADFPANDRLLSSMLDLTLNRILAQPHPKVSLHLHDPHLYRQDRGQRWIDAARRDYHFALLLDNQQPNKHREREGAQIVFRCSAELASRLIDDWRLPASVSDLVELPADTGIARLPGMTVTLKASAS